MTTSPIDGCRRERKKLATRLALNDAALSLVEERGLANVTVEDITERADVSPRTFFNYFSSKEEAVIGRDPAFADQLVAALRARPADEAPFDSLRVVLGEGLENHNVERSTRQRRLRVVKSEPVLLSRVAADFERIEQALTAEVAARMETDAGTDLEPALLVAVLMAASRVALMHSPDFDDGSPAGAAVDDALSRLTLGRIIPRRDDGRTQGRPAASSRTTPDATTADPATADPTTTDPTTADPTTADPTTADEKKRRIHEVKGLAS